MIQTCLFGDAEELVQDPAPQSSSRCERRRPRRVVERRSGEPPPHTQRPQGAELLEAEQTVSVPSGSAAKKSKLVSVFVEVAGGRLESVTSHDAAEVRVFDWDAAEAAVLIAPEEVRQAIKDLSVIAQQDDDIGERVKLIIRRLEDLLAIAQGKAPEAEREAQKRGS